MPKSLSKALSDCMLSPLLYIVQIYQWYHKPLNTLQFCQHNVMSYIQSAWKIS